MSANGDFKGQLGNRENPGLSTKEQRLARLVAGQNPYVTGTSLPGDSPVFFGREQALGEILGALRRPERLGCVSVLGERRIGKSSLINQVYQAMAAEPGLVSIHATAQNWNHDSQEQFFGHLHACIVQTLGLQGEKPVDDFPQLRDFILAQARQGYRFVLMIDEFEVMAGNPSFDAYFFSNLRALADRPECQLGFLVGSRRPLKDLCDEHRIEASSFWNIFGMATVLGLLAEEDVRDLVVVVFDRSLPQAQSANGLRLLEQEIRPLTGCHPALIQIAADAHWNAWAGGNKADDLVVVMRVREYLEDFWNRCREEKAAKAILLRAADGQNLQVNHRVAELMQRGLLTKDRKPFSHLFTQVIAESLPKGKSLSKAAKECERDPAVVANFLERWLPWVERIAKLWNSLKGKEDKK